MFTKQDIFVELKNPFTKKITYDIITLSGVFIIVRITQSEFRIKSCLMSSN